jgi:hypothetical protein
VVRDHAARAGCLHATAGQGSLFGSYAVSTMQKTRDEYFQCLISGTWFVPWLTCPLGGNLHYVLWSSVAVFLRGALMRLTLAKA